MALNPSVLFSY
jgi:hypothetical protein